MRTAGAILINLSLLLQLVALVLASRRKYYGAARRAAKWSCAAVYGALLVLLAGLLSGRQDMVYVYKYTDRSLPSLYRVSALWAGGEGTMLLCLGLASALALSLTAVEKNLLVRQVLMKYYLVVQIVLQVLLRAIGNPFAATAGPGEGLGLNPALQNPGMLVHPPAVIAGYVLGLIPLGYLLSARSIRDIGGSHFKKCRFWAWMTWTVYSFALLSGGLWTYASQRQGRYWSWDTAECSLLAVWFLQSALLCCMEEKERSYHLELLISFLSVLATAYAVVINGGSLLKPVYATWSHTFQRPFLGMLFIATAAAVICYFIYRGKTAEKAGTSSNAAAWLAAIAAAILAADLFIPAVMLLPWDSEIQRSRLLNTVFSFGGLLLLLAFARHAFSKTQSLKAACAGVAAGIAAARLAAALTGQSGILLSIAIFAFTLCLTAALQLAYKIYLVDRVRSRPACRYIFIQAALLMMALGIIGTGGFSMAREWTLLPGQSVGAGRFMVSNSGVDYKEDLKSVMAVVRMEDGTDTVNLFPMLKYNEKQGDYHSKAEIRRGLLYDVVVLFSYFDLSGRARIQVILNPLIFCLWVGGGLMVLAGVYGARHFY